MKKIHQQNMLRTAPFQRTAKFEEKLAGKRSENRGKSKEKLPLNRDYEHDHANLTL